MSISTLLEAARYVEMQEQQRQREAERQAVLDAALNASRNQLRSITPPESPESTTNIPILHITENGKIQHNNGKTNHLIIATGPSGSHTVESSAIFSPVSIMSDKSPPMTANNSPKTGVLMKQSINDKSDQQPHVTSTTVNMSHGRIIHNSFDIMNPLIIDETNPETKRRQPPLVFRSGTREVHNKLEKHRRAHLKECFDLLKKQLPQSPEEKKSSNLSILHSAIRYIQNLKRKEREYEHDMERLARDKISFQQRLAVLKKDNNISCTCENLDLSKFVSRSGEYSHSDTLIISESASCFKDHGDQKSEAMDVDVVMSNDGSHCKGGYHQTPAQGAERLTIPVLTTATVGTNKIAVANGQQVTSLKEVSSQPVQTALSVLPVGYPVSQGLVLQKLIVPKGLTDIAPLVQTHFITTPQQLNGKVVPMLNTTQYVVKPVVVVSTASPRPS